MTGLDLVFLCAVAVAGVLTFFAPCTLPLIPAYVALISRHGGRASSVYTKKLIIVNALSFVFGFSVVFVLFGALVGLFGSVLVEFRSVLAQVGGVLIIVLGLIMLRVIRLDFLDRTFRFNISRTVLPGRPRGVFLAGCAIALGWTPCVGPLLASVLILSSMSGTALEGALLLALFSAGLALPFLALAFAHAHMVGMLTRVAGASVFVQMAGGAFLLVLGILLVTDNFEQLIRYGYVLFEHLGLSWLFDHL